MLKWYLDKNRNAFKFDFRIWLNTKYTVEYWGYHGKKMNARPLSQYKQRHFSINELINYIVIS